MSSIKFKELKSCFISQNFSDMLDIVQENLRKREDNIKDAFYYNCLTLQIYCRLRLKDIGIISEELEALRDTLDLSVDRNRSGVNLDVTKVECVFDMDKIPLLLRLIFAYYQDIYGVESSCNCGFLYDLSECLKKLKGNLEIYRQSHHFELSGTHEWVISTIKLISYYQIVTSCITAEILVSNGFFEEALNLLKSELTINEGENQVEILSLLGRIYLRMGDFDSANEIFAYAQTISNGNLSLIKCNNGWLYLLTGEIVSSIDEFEEAYSICCKESENFTTYKGAVEIQDESHSVGDSDNHINHSEPGLSAESHSNNHFKSVVASELCNLEKSTIINNLAVSYMYAIRMPESLESLENYVFNNPIWITSPILKNLISLYEFSAYKNELISRIDDYLSKNTVPLGSVTGKNKYIMASTVDYLSLLNY